jgi:transposase, IS6 family
LSRVRGRPAARTVLRRGGRRDASSLSGDHGRLKARLRPTRGLKRLATAAVIAAGHNLVQNIRRGHYELAVDVSPVRRLMTAFTELARAI